MATIIDGVTPIVDGVIPIVDGVIPIVDGVTQSPRGNLAIQTQSPRGNLAIQTQSPRGNLAIQAQSWAALQEEQDMNDRTFEDALEKVMSAVLTSGSETATSRTEKQLVGEIKRQMLTQGFNLSIENIATISAYVKTEIEKRDAENGFVKVGRGKKRRSRAANNAADGDIPSVILDGGFGTTDTTMAKSPVVPGSIRGRQNVNGIHVEKRRKGLSNSQLKKLVSGLEILPRDCLISSEKCAHKTCAIFKWLEDLCRLIDDVKINPTPYSIDAVAKLARNFFKTTAIVGKNEFTYHGHLILKHADWFGVFLDMLTPICGQFATMSAHSTLLAKWRETGDLSKVTEVASQSTLNPRELLGEICSLVSDNDFVNDVAKNDGSEVNERKMFADGVASVILNAIEVPNPDVEKLRTIQIAKKAISWKDVSPAQMLQGSVQTSMQSPLQTSIHASGHSPTAEAMEHQLMGLNIGIQQQAIEVARLSEENISLKLAFDERNEVILARDTQIAERDVTVSELQAVIDDKDEEIKRLTQALMAANQQLADAKKFENLPDCVKTAIFTAGSLESTRKVTIGGQEMSVVGCTHDFRPIYVQ